MAERTFPLKRGFSRRTFLKASGALGASVGFVPGLLAAAPAAASPRSKPGYVDLMRPPDRVTVFAEDGSFDLARARGSWQCEDVVLRAIFIKENGFPLVQLRIASPKTGLKRIKLRWQQSLPEGWRYLGDHWERSYGDLEWRGLAGERVMPWYFLASNGRQTHGYGVCTGAAALCFWQADAAGISLWLDVRNGGSGVRLGQRELELARVVSLEGKEGVPPFQAAQAFCSRLCRQPRLPARPVYGWNNWYYTYGEGLSAKGVVRDSELLTELAPSGDNRPCMLIDMGWGVAGHGAGPWERGNERFPDMSGLAARMRKAGVRPGIWVRPLLTTEKLSEAWRLPANRMEGTLQAGFMILDPSVPEALSRVREAIRTIAGWGFEVIKHDFTTFDLLGRWGFQMGPDVTSDGWHFADRSRTSAEIILDLYRALREAAGSSALIGCNTIGHLGAGLFEMQRIGDDNSGTEWHRTRRMGVNTLGFRLAQHNRFFAADADCVPLTAKTPWLMTRQWLDLLARSGTPLFISADPKLIVGEQRQAIRTALARAGRMQREPEPLDWMETTAPRRWKFGTEEKTYDWFSDEGASPFLR